MLKPRYALSFLALCAAACGGGEETPVGPHTAAVAVAISGTNSQSATVGTLVATPPGVHVTDAGGVAVANIAVTFAVTGGGGTLTGTSATTDINGNAFAGSWRLGTTAGTNTMTATVAGVPAVAFTATGLASVATQLTSKTAAPQTAGAGSTVSPAPSVLVSDAFGNPIAGVPVTFAVTEGGGSITGATASTNTSGIATVGSWQLGSTLGSNSLRATSPGLPTVTFSTTTVAGPATSINVSPSSLSLLPQETAQLTTSAVDQFGNAVAGSVVAYTTSNANIATISSTGLVRAVSAGQASIGVTVGTLSKSISITVAAAGHPGSSLAKRIPNINGRPFGIAVSSSGLVAVTQQDLNSITLLDVSGAAPARTVAVGADPGDVVFNRAGTRAWVSNFNAGTVSVVDVASATVVGTIPVASNAYRLALSADESRLFVTSTNGNLYVINLATNAASIAATIGGSLQGMTADANRDFLFITSTNGTVSRVSTATLTVTNSFSVGGTPQDIAIAPNGTALYVANETGNRIDVLDPATLGSVGSPITLNGAFGLAVTPDGSQLFASSPGTVSIIDAATRAPITTLSGTGPRRIAFDHVGSFAVVANEGGFVDVIR